METAFLTLLDRDFRASFLGLAATGFFFSGDLDATFAGDLETDLTTGALATEAFADFFTTDGLADGAFSTGSSAAVAFTTEALDTEALATDAFEIEALETDCLRTEALLTEAFRTEGLGVGAFSLTTEALATDAFLVEALIGFEEAMGLSSSLLAYFLLGEDFRTLGGDTVFLGDGVFFGDGDRLGEGERAGDFLGDDFWLRLAGELFFEGVAW